MWIRLISYYKLQNSVSFVIILLYYPYNIYLKTMTETTLRDFVPLEKLGEGSFSTVYKVKRISDSKIYALKKVRMNNLKDKEKLSAVNEIRILASIDSPYIVGYKEAIYDEKLNLLCIVMEYANGGDLQRCIKKAEVQKAFISEKEIWKAVINILRGLDHLHKKNILHRDLKSANIFLADTLYKLGDLNVSKVNKGRLAYTQIGTPYYASPEVWREEPYDNKSDIWSFGIIIYEMATLRPPFHGHDMEQLYETVQKGVYNKIPSCYSKDLQTVIDYCLRKSPSLRPSADELLDHPIIAKYIQKYMNQPQTISHPNSAQDELLRTIKVPFNMKGLQKNLPKSKYQNTSTKEQSESDKIENKYSPRSGNPIRLGRLLNRNPSQQVIKSIERYSPRNIEFSLNNAGSPRNYVSGPGIDSAVSPRNKIEPTKLSQAKSLQRLDKPGYEPKKSDRYVTELKRESLGNYKVQELKQIQRSLVLQQNQIEEYIQKQLKQRPITCIPKAEHGLIKSNRVIDPPTRYEYGKIQQKKRDEPNEQQYTVEDKRKIDYIKPRQSSLQHIKEDSNVYSSKILSRDIQDNRSHNLAVGSRNANRKIETIKYPSSGIGKVGEYKSKLTPSYWVE